MATAVGFVGFVRAAPGRIGAWHGLRTRELRTRKLVTHSQRCFSTGWAPRCSCASCATFATATHAGSKPQPHAHDGPQGQREHEHGHGHRGAGHGHGHDPKDIDQLLRNNKRWVASMKRADPLFFERLAKGQSPAHFWIGCSDSRVPANEIVGLGPGEVFVHRNGANLVLNTDLNMLACLQFAVEYLKVKHIIVCGHYDCAGVRAALKSQDLGTLEHWVCNIRDVVRLHQKELYSIHDMEQRVERLVELNVMEQAGNVFKTGIVQRRRKETYTSGGVAFPRVHGLVFNPGTGALKPVPVDFKAMVRKVSHIYDLYKEGK